MTGSRPAALPAALLLSALLVAVPLLFRSPPTTLTGIPMLAVNCEGLASGGTDQGPGAVDSLLASVGARAIPGPCWGEAGPSGAWELFPLRIVTISFPSDSSVLALVASDSRLDPGTGRTPGRFVTVRRMGPGLIALAISRGSAGSEAADACSLLADGS